MQSGIVVIGHGSIAAANDMNEVFRKVGEMLKAKAGGNLVEIALLTANGGIQTIEEAVNKLIVQGVSEIVLAPALLGNSTHMRKDIPAKASALQQEHPAVSIIVAEPIGADPRIAAILLDRVGQARQAFGNK